MAYDPTITDAYSAIATVRRWKRERETTRWKLAAAAATNHNLLNGPAILKHATNPNAVGKRKVVKSPKKV